MPPQHLGRRVCHSRESDRQLDRNGRVWTFWVASSICPWFVQLEFRTETATIRRAVHQFYLLSLPVSKERVFSVTRNCALDVHWFWTSQEMPFTSEKPFPNPSSPSTLRDAETKPRNYEEPFEEDLERRLTRAHTIDKACILLTFSSSLSLSWHYLKRELSSSSNSWPTKLIPTSENKAPYSPPSRNPTLRLRNSLHPRP